MNLITLITTVGYLGVAGIVFAESGLLIGFFLPGDSLLFTAGFLASQGVFRIDALIALCAIAAVSGDSVGYAFGRRMGPKIFAREDSIFFHRDHLARAQRFYEHHGAKTIVLARFVPVVRTFAPVLAGVGRMRYPRFLAYNVLGGLLWAAGLPLLGFQLGSVVPGIDRYLLPIVLGIILLSISPGIVHVLRDPSARASLVAGARRAWARLTKRRPRNVGARKD